MDRVGNRLSHVIHANAPSRTLASDVVFAVKDAYRNRSNRLMGEKDFIDVFRTALGQKATGYPVQDAERICKLLYESAFREEMPDYVLQEAMQPSSRRID